MDFRIFFQFRRHLFGVRIYFGEEAEPEHGHLLFRDGVRSELRKFDECEVQALDYLLAILVMYDVVVVDVGVGHIMLEGVVHQVERIYGLQLAVLVFLHSLGNVQLGCIEEYSLHERLAPFHLHLHTKLSALGIHAEHVHNRVLVQVELWHQFCRQVLDALYLFVVAER